MKKTIKIGTRKSKLALVQSKLVKQAIMTAFPSVQVELIPMSTQGDRQLERSLTSFGGKGVFTRELEAALLDRRIDLAVHSAKDMPAELPPSLTIGAVLHRANPQDVLLTLDGTCAKELPPGSIIGTSSLRREIEIKQINPTLTIKMLRGNVTTRIEKLKQGEYDGVILAAAGLERLGIKETDDLHFEYLDTETFIPAPGQGLLAVAAREGELTEILAAIHSPIDADILNAERTFMTLLNAGCNSPCGAYCRPSDDGLIMSVMFAKDGIHPLFQSLSTTDRKKGMRLASQLAALVTCQRVSLVGAGPGDESLLSLKALACIRNADVLIYDNLISPSIINEARMDATLIYAGKRANNHHLPQKEIHNLLIHYALDGNYVVRLKGGDPFVFGRGGEEALILAEHGIPFEIVPGISSSYSVPAYAGIPVTQRMIASSFHVITGHEGEHKRQPVVNYKSLAHEEGTLVFMMGLHNLDYIADQLIQHGKDPNTLAGVIQHGSTARQRIVTGTLQNITARAQAAGIHTPAVTIVGQVVSLHETLSWYSKKPLSGTRTLLTGTRRLIREIKGILDPLGTETIALSLIETTKIQTLDCLDALHQLSTYNWIVFTSPFGIELFFELLNEHQIDIRTLSFTKFAVIGSSCQETLKKYGMIADYVPDHFNSQDFSAEWVPTLSTTDRILILRAREGSSALTSSLKQSGIYFDDIPIYETSVDERRADELNRIVEDVDYVIACSGSAVRALHLLLDKQDLLRDKIISIGPETTKVLTKYGFSILQTASVSTAQGIADTLLDEALRQHKY